MRAWLCLGQGPDARAGCRPGGGDVWPRGVAPGVACDFLTACLCKYCRVKAVAGLGWKSRGSLMRSGDVLMVLAGLQRVAGQEALVPVRFWRWLGPANVASTAYCATKLWLHIGQTESVLL